MTHKTASEETVSILNRFTNQSLEESVISCIGQIYQKDNLNKSENLVSHLEQICSELPAPYYLEESTSGDKKDPQNRLEAQLRNGWQTGGGFRLPLTEVPIWDKYLEHSRNVRYKIHSWVMLDSLLVVDSITDGQEYLDLAVDIAEDWINNFVLSKRTDEFAWYDMAVGQRATKLAYMLRRLIEVKSPSKKIFAFILASEAHFSELLDEKRIATHSNHGLFQMAGLISLCNNLSWMKKSIHGAVFAEEILKKMLNEHFAIDGLHLEHSPDYHLYMVNHLQSLRDSGWLSETFEPMLDLVDSVVDAASWMATPNDYVIPIGDTANNVLMTKRWAGYNGKLQIGSKFYPIGGLYIHNSQINNSLSQLVFTAQFHSRQHKHADHLNVLYNFSGQPLLVDPGTFTYQYDTPERMYCESTRGHNTIEVDGLNYSRFRQDNFGSALTMVAEAGDCILAEGRVKHSRLISSSIPNNKIKSADAVPVDITHRRILIERSNHFLAIIDEIKSEDEHQYTPWYHFHPDLNLRRDTPTKIGVVDNDGQKHCQVQCYDSDSNPISNIEAKGQTVPNLQGWFSKNGRDLIENTTIGYPVSGKSGLFVTVFDFKMDKTGKPYLRKGTGGKYLRFSLTQGSQKVDVKIKINKEGKREIEVEIDNSSVEVEIEFDEG